MSGAPDPGWVVDFPTLWVVPEWITAHCPVADGFARGRPFELYDWQLWCTANHYRVRPEAAVQLDPDLPALRSQAFTNRRTQVVGPQKSGKGPWSATIVAAEAVGPVLFAGWAVDGDEYRCDEHGCGCGWVYAYAEGEPMGQRWLDVGFAPLIQVMSTTEDQVANVWRPLMGTVKAGPLADLILPRENFLRLPDDGRVEAVTSSTLSRLGAPITFALQDETGLYTKSNKLAGVASTMRRNLAGMSGRSLQTTNPWNPAEASDAQTTHEATAADVFRFYDPPPPPTALSYLNKRDRRRIHKHNYRGCTHVDLDAIEAEAAELIERDPAEAERFYGNRVVYGQGSWLDDGLWDACHADAPALVSA